MLLFYFVITLSIVFILWLYAPILPESFVNPEYMEPPYRYLAPQLYPTTGPVDMLSMQKFLLVNGYRFQNGLFPPEPLNLRADLPGQWGPLGEYPQSYRQRTGSFKERAFVEKFESGSASTGASQATLAQVRSRGDQDRYILGQSGDQIELSKDNMDPMGKWVEASVPNRQAEINYPNEVFSWGDIINRFYSTDQAAMDVVL